MLGAAQGANMYLNGWQRIWLVASVCWIIGGSLWIHSFAIDDAHTGYEICFHSRSEGRSAENCESKYAANLHAVVADPYHWLYTAALTLIPDSDCLADRLRACRLGALDQGRVRAEAWVSDGQQFNGYMLAKQGTKQADISGYMLDTKYSMMS